MAAVLALIGSGLCSAGLAQQASPQQSSEATIQGTVIDAAHHLVADASVALKQESRGGVRKTKTNASGAFLFSGLSAANYHLSAEKSTLHSKTEAFVLAAGEQRHIVLVLEAPGTAPTHPDAMQFADQPNFTVAGVTDWTAAGGHGSDVRLRTSEELAREVLVLKPKDSGSGAAMHNAGERGESEERLREALVKDPGGFETNHQLGEFYLRAGRYADAVPLLQASYRMHPTDYGNEYDLALACEGIRDFAHARNYAQNILRHEESAGLHSLLGDLDEESGDPLAAVHEFEKAVSLDPSEANYFAWGSELLLHRAVQPAIEVFQKGAKAYPKSARLQASLGAAFFASGQYEAAAGSICAASDLNPADAAPYVFLGKIEVAAPLPLACAKATLARFAQQQPENALAEYYYAMALLKDRQPDNLQDRQTAEALLVKAVAIDPGFDAAYLRLGILYSANREFEKSIGFYEKAIALNPQSSDAHYRLGVAYARLGKAAKARQEFDLHDQLEKEQAAIVEQQRREIKQFLVVLKTQPAAPPSH